MEIEKLVKNICDVLVNKKARDVVKINVTE